MKLLFVDKIFKRLKTVRIKSFSYLSITTSFLLVVMLFFIGSCADDKLDIADKNLKREQLPQLNASNITTIISDSGVTRYRITTPQWKVFDKTPRPQWVFPKGIHFERFDQKYRVDAEMNAKKAVFYSADALWEFSGKVKAKNLKGEYFETEQLFWDERNDRIYSDKKIKITQQTKIIIGLGFESNATLTRYVIRNPQGVIPLDEKK